jgi:hypothetical protein
VQCDGCRELPGCSVVAELAEVAQPRWSYATVAWSLEDAWSWSAVAGVAAAADAPVIQCVRYGHRRVEAASCRCVAHDRRRAEAAVPGEV